MIRICALLILGTLFPWLLFAQSSDVRDLTNYVDPFIGTQKGGHTFPGVTYPFGMVRLGPDCDNLSSNMGYKSEGKVRGFSHLHINGTGGGPKYGNVLVYPFSGDITVSGYGSERGEESAEVGYFSIQLAESDILAELTCTHKTGVHQYTFSKPGFSGILIDAGSFLGKEHCCFENQELVGSEIEILSNTEIAGYTRVRGGWGRGEAYTVYFYALFDKPAASSGTWKSGKKRQDKKYEIDTGEPVGAWFGYDLREKTTIGMKVGISFVSAGKARHNCLSETSGLSFDQVVNKARDEWNKYLNRVIVESEDESEKVKFYTAIYHSLIHPSDRTGENPKWVSDLPYYDDFYCIWDTYRTVHPLFCLIAPEKEAEMINSLVDIYKHEGYMPDARSGNDNGRTQGGSNSDMLVAEAILKDLSGVDQEGAWEAMVKNAEVPPGGDQRKEGRGGLSDYKSLGYVSTDFERAGSRTVEYAANDWAIAQCARKMGLISEYQKYKQRAGNWENLWRPVEHGGAKGFIMPRKSDGEWDENYTEPNWTYYSDFSPNKVGTISRSQLAPQYLSTHPFTPLSGGSWVNFFYESHSWEYSFYVPQDMKRLIAKCGGNEAFVSRLDTFFNRGYFNINNEPGFLFPSLYIYARRQDKTAELATLLLKKHFSDKPDGLPGNDDSGAMSSWYAFHALGFFPVAGQDVYLIATPHFPKATIHIAGGKKLEITADNLSEKNIYIASAQLNGKPLNQAWFIHSDIKDGGSLKFTMSSKPIKWDTGKLPPSISDDK